MRALRSLAFLAACVVASIAAVELHAGSADVEPRLPLELVVDGEVRRVDIDKPFHVTVNGKRIRMKLQVGAERRFDNVPEFTFRYPTAMRWSYDADGDGSWNLDGKHVTIDVRRLRGSKARAERWIQRSVEAMRKVMGSLREEPTPFKLALGGREHTGLRFTSVVGSASDGVVGQTRKIAFAHGDACFVLTINDFLDDEGRSSKEAEEVLALLQRTFVFKRAPAAGR